MPKHTKGPELYKEAYVAKEMRTIFNAEARFDRWLKIEAALSRVQAQLGIIPKESAAAITKVADISKIDLGQLPQELNRTGHTLVPLLQAMQKACPGKHGEYIHYGVTTKDIEDIGMIIEMRDAFRILMMENLRMEQLLGKLAAQYRSTVIMGKSNSQHGMPTTLGLKFARAMIEVRHNIERMKEAKKRIFVCPCLGEVGARAGFGNKAHKVTECFAKELGLAVPLTSRTNARDTVAEYQALLAFICGTTSYISNEIYHLVKAEILNIKNPAVSTYTSSDVHRKNTEGSEFLTAMCRIVLNNAQLGLQGMISEHERDAKSWRLDWHGIPESSMFTAKALRSINEQLESLQVYEENIAANLNTLGGKVFAEAVLLKNSTVMPGKKKRSKECVGIYAMGMEEDIHYNDGDVVSPVLAPCISASNIGKLFDYKQYTDSAEKQVDAVLSQSQQLAQTDLDAMQ